MHITRPSWGRNIAQSEQAQIIARAPERARAPQQIAGLGLVILAALCWSTVGIFVNRTMQGGGVTAISLAFWRVAVTFVCLAGAILATRPGLLRVAPRDLPWLAGMGALAMGAFQVLWILSLLHNGLFIATVIEYNSPLLVTLLARLFWREALTWRKWAAILLAGAGTLLVAGLASGADVQISGTGLLIAIGSALAYAGITLFGKKVVGRPEPAGYNPWTILVYAFGFATLALLPFQFGRPLPRPADWGSVGAFAALILIPTIGGYTAYTSGLRRLQASVASIAATAEVPLAALAGYLFLGERLDALQAVGALIVIGGVILLSWQPGRDANGSPAGRLTAAGADRLRAGLSPRRAPGAGPRRQ